MCKNREPKRNVLFPDHDGKQLKAWRESTELTVAEIAARLSVSIATYYRYEAGYPPPPDMATDIVHMTAGKVRYRDLWFFFEPRYA